MLAQLQRRPSWTQQAMICLAFVALSAAIPTGVSAQDQEPSAVADVMKRVVFDPTTYAPAVISYYATMRDWQTSQPFFERGATEMNARFTVSGRPNDTPVSYGDGNRRILRDALINLQVSAVTNVADQIVERMLVERYPNHRKLIRVLGWAQRISLSSYLSYRLSIQHFRQTQLNEQLAKQYGF